MSSRLFRSNDAELRNVSRLIIRNMVINVFSVYEPLLWNALPQYIKDINSLEQLLQKWLDLGKIKILHPQKHPITYGIVSWNRKIAFHCYFFNLFSQLVKGMLRECKQWVRSLSFWFLKSCFGHILIREGVGIVYFIGFIDEGI